MRVLVACEYSGRVRDAFIALGHDAMSCDLLPTDQPGPHYQGDVRDILADGWDLMIGHPPCTYLCNSGVRWLHTRSERWAQLDEAAAFFLVLWNAPIPCIALENPVMHCHARERLGGLRPTQTVQPWMFGDPTTKATGLFLRGLDPLEETDNVKHVVDALPYAERAKVHYASPGPLRWKLRSMTPQGIADAMAAQWGDDRQMRLPLQERAA
jgi:hypothetical protein